MNINVFFGEKIKEERIKKNLSQERLALLADIDRTYISDIENGRRKVSLEIGYKLSKALSISLSNLLKDLK
ncbi:helix-turn-helix transcriptional regulator [Tenacibaculum finnmarkense]|uniref:helix-turn-helix domain-containing protein n=1 Tax=Tenacibaculum finnmarkense TaxID=2781243 RepID=UPI00187BC390|nr:helix-turn-helix transcriptional regulator [Tenacibaculum finnmarkense]MBE7686989.1 helix-turn-helix domain-containing protein [Tenacibaculum finnmarkense genomovar ulcerans]MCD8408980.1 helix-turn-helix domain-containing protein [Tenacibaculum finnmarkense genomovar ulcerans]MCG8733054.1 helix-turn-helix transcriptional regulator [Tenacibaculum finnmarkense]MCG8802408.1 helix-turn-helix transcriptional regulator [Tenacibaculum finnmarkense]MCG8825136.1 helix-turn-helix transcriptional regu